ncbi:MAG: ubiquitin-like domain-containing protein [Actinomycetota bacterium]
MAQPAHLVVVKERTAPVLGAFVPTSTSQLEISDCTHISRASLPPYARALVRIAVLAIAIAAPVVAFAGEREVKIDVEGKTRTVRTYAIAADELLQRKGIATEKNDLVAGGTLTESDTVTYRKAKPVRLVLDGQQKTVVARGLTVGDALKDLGLVPGPKDHLHPAKATALEPGLRIFVRNAVHTKLRVDGRVRDVVSSADSVSNLLVHAGVVAGKDDYVFPARDTEPTDGMWIRVVRVRRVVEQRNVRVAYQYISHKDPEMESGVRKVVQQGSEGLKVQRYSVLLEDGVRVSSSLLGETTVRKARDHIVRVGTKPPTFKGGGSSQVGIASWFEAEGLVAAHRSLPIGSVVKVTDQATGKSVNVRINQRGPFVEGRVIDLSDDAFAQLAPLDKGTIKVKVQS